MTNYLILQKADREGFRKVLTHIRSLCLTRKVLRHQLRAMDPTRQGTSRLRLEELKQELASLVLKPTWDMLLEIRQHRAYGSNWREGWNWMETASEVIK